MDEAFERRLDQLRDEARSNGQVSGSGVRATGSPLPMPVGNPQAKVGPGYHGLPIIKPPVWEWMIAVYFFVGGLAGMSGLIAMAALTKDQFELVRTAMWAAGMGAILSPALLIADLGRPMRFLNMLRVFKYQSPMSVGSWIVSSFGAFAVPGLALVEWQWRALHGPSPIPAIGIITWILVVGAGVVGIFLATYTGALLAVTAVPAWNVHRAVLPFHFGMAGLGSAAAVLEMAGFRSAALDATGFLAASAETLVLLWLEFHRHGATDRALHQGRAGWTLRAGELLEGPLALALRSGGLILPAAASFTLGALVTRFGWLWAGRSCAQDPEAVLASQTSTPRPAETRLPYSLEPAVASRLDSRGG